MNPLSGFNSPSSFSEGGHEQTIESSSPSREPGSSTPPLPTNGSAPSESDNNRFVFTAVQLPSAPRLRPMPTPTDEDEANAFSLTRGLSRTGTVILPPQPNPRPNRVPRSHAILPREAYSSSEPFKDGKPAKPLPKTDRPPDR